MKTILRTRTETAPGIAGNALRANRQGLPATTHPGPGPFSAPEARDRPHEVRNVLLTGVLVLYPIFGSVALVLASFSITGASGLS
ncbi:MAG TPA: hypothetical protein VFP43_08125 [Mesorhizobium sp.]|jgi:hypothetical protein|nr:hypothetical protein [Mesorhizobium sp.]